MLPAAELVGLTVEKRDDTVTGLDSPDDGEAQPLWIIDRGEQLEVLAETEVVDRRSRGEWHRVEVEHAADA